MTYILIGDPYFGLYPVTTTFGPTPGYQVQGFTLNRYTLPPLVVTTAAAPVSGAAANAWFEWDAPAASGNSTPPVSVGNGTSAVPASATLTGLNPSVAYHYRIVGSNSAGMTYGSNMTFVNPLPQSSRGYALSFASSADHVRIPGFLTIVPNTEITVKFWLKVNAADEYPIFGANMFVNGSAFYALVP